MTVDDSAQPVSVVYLAGAPRSGTTIVALLLGQLPGFFNAGEVRFLWRQILEAGTCGCGAEVRSCPVWSRVLDHNAAAHNGTLHALVESSARHSLIRTLPLAVVAERFLRRVPAALQRQAMNTEVVLRAIRDRAGAKVVVDSSKSPSFAYMLGRSAGVRLDVVHVLREPRAVVYSWLRERGAHLSPAMRLRGVVYHALKWDAWNLWTSEILRRRAAGYELLVYEEFAADPVAGLLSMAGGGWRREGLPVSGGPPFVASLGVNHTLFGNGNRFQVGSVPIRIDDEWRDRMRWHERMLVAALTWPVRARYRSAA